MEKLLIENYDEKFLNLYENCVPFGFEESKKLREYITSISVEEKDNVFDYYIE